jgi:hypothetical protein
VTHPTIVALNDRIQQTPLGLCMCLHCGQVFDSNHVRDMESEDEREPKTKKTSSNAGGAGIAAARASSARE